MNTKYAILQVIAIFLMVVVSACTTAQAGSGKVNAEAVWARPSRAASNEMMGTVSGVFMMIKNESAQSDRLVGASTDVARTVEIHETLMDGEVAKMQKLADGLEIPAKASVELKPGGYHVMLINLNQDLKVGDKITLELQFEKAGTITVEAEVKDPASMMP